MKVALFFDGKNFYSGWRERAARQPLDFAALARWLVRRVGGSVLWGAYYYTGIETGTSANGSGQTALTSFLDNLEMLPGYFVQRFPRRSKSYHCRECNAENYFTQENEVDTTMVADMLRLAAVGAFDIMVLMSGDADHAPAVEGVRALGRQAYVATWGGVGLSRRIRRAAFDHINLCESLAECGRQVCSDGDASDGRLLVVAAPGEDERAPSSLTPTADIESAADALVDEIRRAESKFPSGYVGVNFFVTRWQASTLDPDPDVRRRLIDKVVREDRVELYTTEEGTKAIRVKRQPTQDRSP
ncbi:MAG: NYN domain-containing protein [Myxococcales bacterium]|nr:NYN domain-containing protein [Myxococcota bacterium]MDW8283520.1 NYN domain-containing protein [Myxococcales bacterium]